MSDSIDARLREVARLSAAYLDSDEGRRDMERRAREARRTELVDMTASAIDARLRELAKLSQLCRSLGAAVRR
jgi:hypothetical protein